MASRLAAVLLVGLLAACSGGDDDADESGATFAADIVPAIEAVEAELGGGQEYFEVTATSAFTNLFVAVDEATSAVPYVFLDGELQPPAPALTGASGFTFGASDVEFDADSILDAVAEELPEATIEALSIEGTSEGGARYVVAAVSAQGGVLAITVSPDGTVLEVDPL